MRAWLEIIVCIFLTVNVWAQQQTQSSHHVFNKYYLNPAYGGLERSLSAFAGYRDQYSAFPGNPRVFLCNADMPIYRLNGAAGFSLMSHTTGLFKQTQVKTSYNYVQGTQFGFVSIGVRAGLEFMQVDGSGITTPDGDYEGVIQHNDPTLANSVYSGIGPVWEVGAYFFNNTFEAGLTIAHIPSHQNNLGPGRFSKSALGTAFGLHKYPVSETITLFSSCLLQWDPAAIQSDVSVLLKIEDKLTAGLGFRGYGPLSGDALIVYLGTNIGQKYNLMYSYDLGVSALRSSHQGSHEITVSYNLQTLIGLGLPPKIIYNPRDL